MASDLDLSASTADSTMMSLCYDQDPVFSIAPTAGDLNPGQWRTFGSEKLVESMESSSRHRIKLSLRRPRKFFGLPYNFSTFNGNKQQPLFFELAPSQNRGERLDMLELETGVQAAKKFATNGKFG